jgi:hypothetical protein
MKAMEDEKARARNDSSFLEKKDNFLFNPDADARIRGVGSSKDFEIYGILEKEPRSVKHTSYQADRHGYLPEVKIESSEQMPDRVNNRAPDQRVPRSQSPNSGRQKV